VSEAQVIAQYQPTLYAIAYRMLGSIADAEDLVHDTFLKWLTIDTSKIRNTKAFLVRMLTNNCLNFLQGSRKRFTENGLEELDMEAAEAIGDQELLSHEKDGQIAAAWRVMARKLEPAEKAIYVLRELFNLEYDDLQDIVGKSKDNCRQIFSRAKNKLNQAEMPKLNLDISLSVKLPKPFVEACHFGQLSDLISELKTDLLVKKKK
jgi:RNA polymerase sigma factor (sigma-70 family)